MSIERPNILLLISHDLGCHIGPYGFAKEASPNLRRLAAQGARFEAHFVTSPGCSQSRASLVTGRYPHCNGQLGLAHLGWTLNRDEVLLPAVLRGAGYRTALTGIWHLHDWTLGAFDDVADDASTRDRSPEGFAEVASHRAAAWLRSNAGQGKPFYLHVGFWETHRPFCGQAGDPTPLPELDSSGVKVPDYLPDNEPTRREFAHLQKSIEHVDAGVARILDALEQTGQAGNTLVIFTADHGLPFPRAKGTLYDPGIQAAFLARWPGRIAPGSVSGSLTSNLDVMSTLLEAANAEVPTRAQGRSLLPLLLGRSAHSGRDTVFAEKTYHEHYDPIRCVRTARLKYIRNFADRPRLVMPSDVYNSPTRQSMGEDERFWSHRPAEELYDLTADRGEVSNLAGSPEHREELGNLRGRLEEWMQQTADPLLKGPVPRAAR